MKTEIGTLATRLASALGKDSVQDDARTVRAHAVDGVIPSVRVVPRDVAQIGEVLKICGETGAAVIPWGGGTSMGLGNVPRRVDVALSLEYLVEGSQAALRIAEIRAGLTVSVAATSSVQVSPNAGQTGWGISATLSYPVADGGRTKAAVDEAKANLDAARARAEVTTQQVQLQAFQAALGVQQTRARLEAVRVSAAAADESMRVAEGRYRAGVTILLEVLDAQVASTEARVTLVQTEYDLRLAGVTLRHSLGRPVLQSAQSAQSPQSRRP